jgi:hypothetical protein
MARAWTETGGWKGADLWWAIDADDPEMGEYIKQMHDHGHKLMHIAGEWEPMVPKLNRVAKVLAEQYAYVGFMGDDHLPRTFDWSFDITSELLFGQRPRIVYGRDGLQDQRLATWWVMDSRIVLALGRMVPADVQHLYCDNAIMDLGRQAGCLDYMESILIEHMHPVAGKAPWDDGHRRVNRKQQYERDRAAYSAWVGSQLASDVRLVQQIGG